MLRFLEVESKWHFLSNTKDKLISFLLSLGVPIYFSWDLLIFWNGVQTTLTIDNVVTYGGFPIENEFFAPSITSLTFANYPELFKIRWPVEFQCGMLMESCKWKSLGVFALCFFEDLSFFYLINICYRLYLN